MDNRPYVSWELMNSFIIDSFKAFGVPEDDAAICADVILESDRRGIESHGCNRFIPFYINRIKKGTLLPVTNIEVVRDTPTTVVLDAHDGMGMVASHRMMEMLIEKAGKFGMAGGVIRNSTHYGIAGYWATMASKAGMLGMTGTNARPATAPTFGIDNMMGTNPMTFAFPTDEEFPFCLDCATSIVQRGKIEYYARQGKDVPAGLVVGEDGRTMTDSAEILQALVDCKAALAPLGGIGEETGGYKGYGYAAVVEILSAALAGGPFMRMLNDHYDENGRQMMYHLGHFFFVANPEFFCGLDVFKKTAGDICRALRASRKAPGCERIYTAGEKEWLMWQERKDKGVPIGEGGQEEILALRDELGLPYRFPFG